MATNGRGSFSDNRFQTSNRLEKHLAGAWNAGEVLVDTEPSDAERTLHVVVLGFGLKTTIKRGENSGRRLTGNFVVLDHQTKIIAPTV
ncbi:MAG: hypothetical protein M2R45_01010 [Verrucomicrobia subdivision 3 bacterium]|nr:hypothetical protein [Limisphaerales bacterium]